MSNKTITSKKNPKQEQEQLHEVIREEIIERLPDYVGNVEIADLIFEMYNNDYYIIGTYQAEEFIGKHVHEVFRSLKHYQEEFGDAYPDIENPEKVATLTVLMIAEEIFNSNDVVSKNWDKKLNDSNVKRIIDSLKKQNLKSLY